MQSTSPSIDVNSDELSTHFTQPNNAAQQLLSTDRQETAVHGSDSQRTLQHNEELGKQLGDSAMFPSGDISMQPPGSNNLHDQSPGLQQLWVDVSMSGPFDDIGRLSPSMLPSNSETPFPLDHEDGSSQKVVLRAPLPDNPPAVRRQKKERKPHLIEILEKEMEKILKNGFRGLSPEEIAQVRAMQTELDNQKLKVCRLFYFPIL